MVDKCQEYIQFTDNHEDAIYCGLPKGHSEDHERFDTCGAQDYHLTWENFHLDGWEEPQGLIIQPKVEIGNRGY